MQAHFKKNSCSNIWNIDKIKLIINKSLLLDTHECGETFFLALLNINIQQELFLNMVQV